MKKVTVVHSAFGAGNVSVAEITIPAELGECSVDGMLEYAFERTQNIMGSWSRGPVFDNGEKNGDYRPSIKVLVDLPVHEGRTMGLRSTSVGDMMYIGTRKFEVMPFGFEEK